MINNQKVGAIIAAAGRGERMAGVDKMFALLGGKPVLAQTVSVFEASPLIDQVVIVLGEHNIEKGKKLLADEGWSKVTDVCAGGKRRQD